MMWNVYHERVYWDGVVEGITRYAHWLDGIQYVGTCGKTLTDAIQDVRREALARGFCYPESADESADFTHEQPR
jgi:hypothetical protein